MSCLPSVLHMNLVTPSLSSSLIRPIRSLPQELWNEMLVAHLCQHGLVLSQVYKWVLVPWMGNPSVISPLPYFGEWCSSSYLHFLLPSHLLQEKPGQGKAFVYFLPCCSTGWIFPAAPHLHWAHQELSAWRLPDVPTVWAQVWASTGIHLSGLCR